VIVPGIIGSARMLCVQCVCVHGCHREECVCVCNKNMIGDVAGRWVKRDEDAATHRNETPSASSRVSGWVRDGVGQAHAQHQGPRGDQHRHVHGTMGEGVCPPRVPRTLVQRFERLTKNLFEKTRDPSEKTIQKEFLPHLCGPKPGAIVGQVFV
jgi:hypothetical protein